MRILCICMMLLGCVVCPVVQAAPLHDWQRLEAAAALAEKEGLEPVRHQQGVAAAIAAYLQALDPYSSYISPAEARQLKEDAANRFGGVGMDIIQNSEGMLYCLPHAGSPAANAGIGYGDVLRAVDGAYLHDKPLRVVRHLVRGPAHSQVRLLVAGANGAKEVTVTREMMQPPSAELLAGQGFYRIRLTRFDAQTLPQLKAALAGVPAGMPLVLDVRGNIGGELEVALQSASLFLPQGTALVTILKKDALPDVQVAAGGGTVPAGFVVVWQDAFTASAAEVFAAALAQNGKAVLVGQRSFGKGRSQVAVPAKDGGIYLITNAELLPPNGISYHGKGLEPDLLVGARSATVQADFERRTYEAFGKTH